MTTLYIRLPSKAAADSAEDRDALSCPFALVSGQDAIEREGISPLANLPALVGKAQRVVLMLAASDVTLLRVRTPPMSAARLRAALPGLVEDQLISDPADSVVVAGGMADGLRTVAVVRRDWLELLVRSLSAAGARQVAALPAQLCLPVEPGHIVAAVSEFGTDIDLTLRLSEHDGIGLPILPEHPGSAPKDVIESLAAMVPQESVVLYVPRTATESYAAAIQAQGLEHRIGVSPDSWPHWLEGARATSLNLATGLGAASGPKINWRPWRWPLILAGLLLFINVAALNFDWWRLRSEASSLRAAQTQIYRAAYPKDPVIVDPMAQMRQKIAAAKRDTGQPAPDDLLALASGFGEAWGGVMQDKAATGIAALEYRERSLFVRLKPEIKAPAAQLQAALAPRGLSMTAAPAQSSAEVWQIRSGK